jgi:hypothetical protein
MVRRPELALRETLRGVVEEVLGELPTRLGCPPTSLTP